MAALCEAQGRKHGGGNDGREHRQAARWLEQVDKARAVVAWVPPQYLPEDERTAYRIQDAFLKKLIPKQGPVVG